MRLRFLRAAAVAAALSTSILACTAAPEGEETETDSAELVQFPASAFANPVPLAYGQESAAIDYRRGIWGVVKFTGTAGDAILATVTPTTADRLARAYLVHKRADGKFVAILSGTAANDGLVKATLDESKDYYIVFREYRRRNASFTVKLERANAPAAGCAGAPLLEPEIIARTPQALEPGFTVTGAFESNVRRCNVATGCADPVKIRNENTSITLRKQGASWQVVMPGLNAGHDGTTGELRGATAVRADDGRNVPVEVKGVSTTGCITATGRARSEVDAITYYDVDVTFLATTPPVAPRVAYPDTPPATECDGQELITDEELLARFPRGGASVTLGAAYIMQDSQYCHPLTGCRDWTRGRTDNYQLQATAYVLGPDTLGMEFYHTRGVRSAKFTVADGTVQITRDVLERGGNAQNVSSISDTHLSVKERDVFVSGEYKHRRYVCIPIPAHP